MNLACQRIELGTEDPQRPWLVLIHGFLGSGDDWQPLLPYLGGWRCLLVDLPGHGASASVTAAGFADVSQHLSDTLRTQNIDRYWLVGYSLGGRISLYHACFGESLGLQGLLVEGGHPGLQSVEARQARQYHDACWSDKLRQLPLQSFLQLWYQQPIFATLSAAERQQLIALRMHNRPQSLGAIYNATSLAVQADFRPRLRELTLPYAWLCGSQDHKFQSLATESQLPIFSVADAGHNAHRAQPAAFARQLLDFIA